MLKIKPKDIVLLRLQIQIEYRYAHCLVQNYKNGVKQQKSVKPQKNM